MYRGRYQPGDTVPVFVVTRDASGTPAWPVDVPNYAVFSAAGVKLETGKMPVVDRYGQTGAFGKPLVLGSAYTSGSYRVVSYYQVGSYQGLQEDGFEIADGGTPDGAVVSMAWYERPHARFLLQQLDTGRLVFGRNPRI